MFPGKKYVWFPDKENAYVQGELVKTENGKCTIKASESGKVNHIDLIQHVNLGLGNVKFCTALILQLNNSLLFELFYANKSNYCCLEKPQLNYT